MTDKRELGVVKIESLMSGVILECDEEGKRCGPFEQWMVEALRFRAWEPETGEAMKNELEQAASAVARILKEAEDD